MSFDDSVTMSSTRKSYETPRSLRENPIEPRGNQPERRKRGIDLSLPVVSKQYTCTCWTVGSARARVRSKALLCALTTACRAALRESSKTKVYDSRVDAGCARAFFARKEEWLSPWAPVSYRQAAKNKTGAAEICEDCTEVN